MAFADPQSLTINAVAQTLPRVSSGTNESTYTKDDGTVKMAVRHSYGKRDRSTIRVDFKKVAADPFLSGVNKEYSMAVYLVIDTPPVGFTNTEQKYVVDALSAYLTASSGANVTKILGGES
jgi:hypothetical protein